MNSELIVIESIVDTTVDLWHRTLTDSTWRVSGVRFEFPTGTSIEAHEKIVLTSITPANFRTKYNLEDTIQVFQYNGKISNGGEEIGLWALDRSDTTNSLKVFMPNILLDAVEYETSSPWPVSASGYGDFLLRINNDLYGNESTNWMP
ncbi:MAG: hypothetical protein HRT71_16500 [Flavobacteriales bacterium]|nr:hypothetical protein [Flavobacteriales bacterium]